MIKVGIRFQKTKVNSSGKKRNEILLIQPRINDNSSPVIVRVPGQKHNNDKMTPLLIKILITFSRQKLALLQSGYIPRRCNCCDKTAPDAKLKQCSKCKTAKYCSKECQKKDLDTKHKSHCKEIRRLLEIINKKDITKRSVVNLSLSVDEGHMLQSSNRFFNMYIRGQTFLFHSGGTFPLGIIALQNHKTLQIEEVLCNVPAGHQCFGVEVCDVTGKQYMATLMGLPKTLWPHYKVGLMSLHTYSERPLYTYKSKPQRYQYGPICILDGTLLIVYNETKCAIELDVKNIPFKETELILQMGVRFEDEVQNVSAMKRGNEKRLIIQYKDKMSDSYIKCIDYQSQELWKFGKCLPDGSSFHPYHERIPHFPLGGANPHWRGHQPPTQALFGENKCKNERIWSC